MNLCAIFVSILRKCCHSFGFSRKESWCSESVADFRAMFSFSSIASVYSFLSLCIPNWLAWCFRSGSFSFSSTDKHFRIVVLCEHVREFSYVNENYNNVVHQQQHPNLMIQLKNFIIYTSRTIKKVWCSIILRCDWQILFDFEYEQKHDKNACQYAAKLNLRSKSS